MLSTISHETKTNISQTGNTKHKKQTKKPVKAGNFQHFYCAITFDNDNNITQTKKPVFTGFFQHFYLVSFSTKSNN